MIVFEIFFIIGLLMGIAIFMVTIQGLYRSWWLNGKPKPGKWYPIRWTEFKYRPGGNKNAIELLRPDHVVIQVPLKLKPNFQDLTPELQHDFKEFIKLAKVERVK